MGFLISHKSGEQRRALLPERRESFMQSATREECLMMQADSLIALMQLYGVSNIEMITEEGRELSSSILCRMWAGNLEDKVWTNPDTIYYNDRLLDKRNL